jgi:phosphatidylglycerophosphatase A
MSEQERRMQRAKTWQEHAAVWLATGLGVGLISVAPGTFGTLWGIPIAWAILSLPHIIWQFAVLLALWFAGVWVCGLAAKTLNLKDPGCVVWDEFVALPVVFLGMSVAEATMPLNALIGFLLFRFFDITKLPPCRRLEKLPGGWGIMADDLAAALYALLAMWLLRALVPPLSAAG